MAFKVMVCVFGCSCYFLRRLGGGRSECWVWRELRMWFGLLSFRCLSISECRCRLGSGMCLFRYEGMFGLGYIII